jgi:mono/diheme cytochrome c family protein
MKTLSARMPRSALLSGAIFFALSSSFGLLAFAQAPPPGADAAGLDRFHKEVQPLLGNYCFDCHADGAKKGGIDFDQMKSADALLRNRELWWKVLKNVRAGIMPPAKRDQLSAQEKQRLERWIKYDALGIDPNDLDPGRVTLRRLNRVEYRNTIRDLTGVDYKTDAEFPSDDTGYGFDNIGDVLSISPLLLEKYMQAAKTIVDEAVPKVPKAVAERTVAGQKFRGPDGKPPPELHSFYKQGKYATEFQIDREGDYRVTVNLGTKNAFEFDPGRMQVVIKIEEQEATRGEIYWANGKTFNFPVEQKFKPGKHHLEVELKPLTPLEKKKYPLELRVAALQVQGPLDPKDWVATKNYTRFFSKEEPPADPAERRLYAREVLARFARKAYRRPADPRLLDRLVPIAEIVYNQPDKSFEHGVAQAMAAVLSSPRFLFRVEEAEPGDAKKPFAFIDDYSLASRLSYFLWSTMPDEALMDLAARGELRKNLTAQVKRMVADPRSEALSQNFAGQWLQARDVETMPFNAKIILKRDGIQKKFELDRDLRQAMRLETQMFFDHIFHEDRSVLEFLDSDYTFLNEKLAQHYEIGGVKGATMRRVQLPKDSPRGGVLTQASVLLVTSNPTRTSPVKRGLFVLDNILGTPAPPPPPDVPQLEEAVKSVKGKEPTMRQAMELHRSAPLCSACHSRMDPLGLGLENFNALGMYREKESGQPIDVSGKLITGETFEGLAGLKRILKNERRGDFYRCLTEKMLTYALGRGLEYYDVATVDAIVERLERDEGRFSALLTAIMESAPFLKRRNRLEVAPNGAGKSLIRDKLQP